MSPEADNRYAPPAASVNDVGPMAGTPALASRWRRLAGSMLDGIIIFIPGFALSALFGWDMFTQARLGGYRALFINTLIGTGSFLALNAYLLVDRGQTIAKAALGMRIVRPDGGKVAAFNVLALRYGSSYLAAMVPAIGALYGLVDALMIFGDQRRCLHDRIAGTIVVRT